MSLLEEPQKLIQESKKKFALYAFLSLVVFFSVIGFGYSIYTQAELDQVKIQNSYKNVTSQINLIQKIQLLLDQMIDVDSEARWNRRQDKLSKYRKSLSSREKLFQKWLDENDQKEINEVDEKIYTETISKKFKKYLEVLTKFETVNFENRKQQANEVLELTQALQTDLVETLNQVQVRVQAIQSSAFDNYKSLSLFLVFICVFQILVIWWIVFVPLYKTIKAQQEKILQSVFEIEAANRSKTDFLANISHEIRTPMTAILGYTEILKKNEGSQDDKEDAIRIIDQNADHLLGLIDDILDIAKIESGKFQVEKQETDFVQLLNQVFSLLNVKAQEKDLELVISFETKVPESLMIDPKRIKQILFNIIGNAIKFTDKGRVRVLVSFFSTSSELLIMVSDTGIGMKKSQVKKLFKPFQQADTSVTRKYGGSGLGLVLSRDLARQMRGDIKVHRSSPGEGTDMEIRLRVGQLSGTRLISDFSTHVEGEPEEIQDKSLVGINILVVDDAKENARLFGLYLSTAGANVKVAYRGEEALNILESDQFDAVLLDLQMPGMDGFTVLKEIKKRELSCPVVALTAHGMEEEKQKTAEAGFADHIVKPVKSDVLIERVSFLVK